MNDNFYKSIIKDSPMGYANHKMICDSEGKPCDYEFIEVNLAFERITGLKANDIIGKRLTDIFPDIKNCGLDWIGVYDNVAFDGEIREFDQFFEPLNKYLRVKAFSHKKNYFTILLNDITEEKNAKQKEINFRKLFDNMTSGCVFYEVKNDGKYGKDYIVKDFNKESLRLEGRTRAEVIGKSLYDIRPNIDEFGLLDDFREVWKTGISKKVPAKLYTDEKFSNWYENSIYKLPSGEIVAVYNDVTDIKQTQDKLRKSRNKFKQYLEEAPYGIFVTDETGKNLEVNKEACKITGYTEKELVGKSLWELVPDKDSLSKNLEVLNKKGVSDAEWKVITKSNEMRDWHIRAIKLSDTRFIEFAEEITEKLETQNKLIRSERDYNQLFSNMFDACVMYKPTLDVKENMIGYKAIKTNLAFDKTFEFISATGLLICNACINKSVACYDVFKRVMKTGISEKFALLCPKKEKYFDVSVYAIDKNSFAVIYKDVTKRNEAKKKLLESEKKYRAIFEQVAVGVCNLSLEGKVIDANKKYCDIFGYSVDELKKLSFLDRTHPDDIIESKVLFSELMEGKVDNLYIEKRGIRKDGTVIFTILSVIMLKDEKNKPLYIVTTVQDITEQKRLEKEKSEREAHQVQQQRLESIGTLAGGVAHEINNPINGIMNYSQLILDSSETDSENAKYAKEIIHESERVATIVKNLLQFSRHNKQAHSYASIETIIEQTLSLVRTVILQDQIDLQVDVQKDLPKLKCRSQQIQQVLMNLLTNARDALNQRYKGYHEDKIIKIQCKQFSKQKRKWLRITVEDHGEGIPPDVQEKMCNPFFTTKNRDEGTGLGLAISHGIVTGHHGKLTFDTKVGSYTQFCLDLLVDNGWENEEKENILK